MTRGPWLVAARLLRLGALVGWGVVEMSRQTTCGSCLRVRALPRTTRVRTVGLLLVPAAMDRSRHVTAPLRTRSLEPPRTWALATRMPRTEPTCTRMRVCFEVVGFTTRTRNG